MSTSAPDPQIHDPERLRVVATLAALPDGDALALTRLQGMLGLTPGSLITRLRELDHAGYVRTEKTGGDRAQAIVALTCDGRAALDHYAAVLRRLPRVTREDHQPPAPYVRVGDADRDAAAAALGEHFAQGRLTLDELDARLDATLTATTHGELSQAAWDQPNLETARSYRNCQARRAVALGMTTGHKITITPADVHIEVILGGEKLAESDRAVLLSETGLPGRYYFPREDVRTELLRPTASQTTCPFKGQASYWSVQIGDETHDDLVWSYRAPIPEAEGIADLMCFYNERVELIIGGERQPG